MATQMVRKQIYIRKRQDILLKNLAQARGLSEAEIIRQALERELGSTPAQPVADEQAAWNELVQFVDNRAKQDTPGQPYRWNRMDAYEERESRWLRDREQDQTMAPVLIDTNVLVYLYDKKIPIKQQQAKQLLGQLNLSRNGRLSVQSLSEFLNVSTRKLVPPLTRAEAMTQVILFARMWPIFDLTPMIVLEAARGGGGPRPLLLRCPDLGRRPPEPGAGHFQ